MTVPLTSFSYTFAPMATLSHEGLRRLIHRYGDPDEYFTEMIHAPSFIRGGKFESWYVRTGPSPDRLVWQLTGGDAEPLAEAARRLVRLGGMGIDLNMGCSAPDIARFGAGISWMTKERSVTLDMVSRVRAAIDAEGALSSRGGMHRLSVKLRLGLTEDHDNLRGFCRDLVDAGVESITLHPRIKSDSYSRPARHSCVERLAADLRVPVSGNGDIMTADEARSYRQTRACSGLMIGRGAVTRPWIFRDLAAAGSAERIDHREVSEYFMDALAECQPPEFHLSRARRFFFYYCDNFTFAHHIKMKIQKAQSPEDIGALLDQYFTEVPEDRYALTCRTGETPS